MAEAMHRCRLYCQYPAHPSAIQEVQLARAIEDTGAACVLLCLDDQPADENHLAGLVDLVQARGLACLIHQDAALADRLGADGVHIEADPTTYAEARKRLGDSASIGAGCGLNRHDAMLLAELGADYVGFGTESGTIDAIDELGELIAWWSEIFVVPCVAWNVDSASDAAKLAVLGADFIAPPRRIWREEDALKRIGEIDSAIRRARRAA
jgi:thiamine-phosphate pyrophosphorylase